MIITQYSIDKMTRGGGKITLHKKLKLLGGTMSKKVRYLVMLVLMLGSLIATLVAYNAYSNKADGNTSVSNNGEVVKELVTNINDICPGKEEEIEINLDIDKGFSLSISFKEITKEALLNEYLVVNVKTQDNKITKNLKDVINKDEILIGNDINNVTISYLLPSSVDNSTQNQETSFSVILIARRE